MIKGEIIINFNRMRFDLQRFADAGSVVNATVAYVNSSTGNQTAFSGANTLAPEMKDYYNNELLENYRVKQIFTQFGRRHTLPARHKGVSEFRKVNAFNTASLLTEGAVPAGQKMGFTTVQATVNQYGTYISISDKLELRAGGLPPAGGAQPGRAETENGNDPLREAEIRLSGQSPPCGRSACAARHS